MSVIELVIEAKKIAGFIEEKEIELSQGRTWRADLIIKMREFGLTWAVIADAFGYGDLQYVRVLYLKRLRELESD